MDKEMQQQFDMLLSAVQEGFREASRERQEMRKDIGVLQEAVGGLQESVTGLQQDMKSVKSTMPTKEFVSDMNADLAAEIGKRIRLSNDEQRLFAKRLIEFLKLDNGVLKQEHIAELEEMLT